MSETFKFSDFLSEVSAFAAGGSKVAFGEILRQRMRSQGTQEGIRFFSENRNGLCLARFLDQRRGIRAGLITGMHLRPDCVQIIMYDPTLEEVEVPYEYLSWFYVEGKNVSGKYTIHNGVLVKDEPSAEGAASELDAPPTPALA